mmetsp:Transcript_1376/g.2816  ORF Transcript_1376/g.2816 Transcript_1376/m.2816 type:complete len:277 (+) Transcript_1376:307-1137(+)
MTPTHSDRCCGMLECQCVPNPQNTYCLVACQALCPAAQQHLAGDLPVGQSSGFREGHQAPYPEKRSNNTEQTKDRRPHVQLQCREQQSDDEGEDTRRSADQRCAEWQHLFRENLIQNDPEQDAWSNGEARDEEEQRDKAPDAAQPLGVDGGVDGTHAEEGDGHHEEGGEKDSSASHAVNQPHCKDRGQEVPEHYDDRSQHLEFDTPKGEELRGIEHHCVDPSHLLCQGNGIRRTQGLWALQEPHVRPLNPRHVTVATLPGGAAPAYTWGLPGAAVV